MEDRGTLQVGMCFEVIIKAMLSFEKVELFFPLTTKTNSVGLLEGSTVFHSVFTPQFDPQLELFLMTSASITSHVTCLG